MEVFQNYICESCHWEIRLNALDKLIYNEMDAQILQTDNDKNLHLGILNDATGSCLNCNKS